MDTQHHPQSEDNFVTIKTTEEQLRHKEGRAKLIILTIIGILTIAYGVTIYIYIYIFF